MSWLTRKESKEMFPKFKKEYECDWCGKEIDSAQVSKRSHVGVSFCSPGCVADWEAHVE